MLILQCSEVSIRRVNRLPYAALSGASAPLQRGRQQL